MHSHSCRARVSAKLLDTMATANTSPFLPTSTTSRLPTSLVSQTRCTRTRKRKRGFSLHASSSQSTQPQLPLNIDYLKREFAGPGVSFEPIGAAHGCSVRLRLDNKSLANVTMPGGIITSYRPQMWHGGQEEVLHTMVSCADDGSTRLQGGVSVHFQCTSDDSVWTPRHWVLRGVKGTPDKSIQIDFFCSSMLDGTEAQYAVTLSPNLISSELSITNNSSSPRHITGCILNHLKASTPDATYMIGLQSSSYFICEPIKSEFAIFPLDASKTGTGWAEKGLDGLFGKRIAEIRGKESDIGEEIEEESNYVHMTQESSRFYKDSPSEFTVLDRGRRNSVKIGKSGFDKLYTMSPGSGYEWYGRYAYVCVGPVVLEPVVLYPGDVWHGSQYLYNPNL